MQIKQANRYITFSILKATVFKENAVYINCLVRNNFFYKLKDLEYTFRVYKKPL